MYQIQNAELSATFLAAGAELSSLKDRATGLEYLWQADPAVWGSHAPVLFPIIGGLRGGSYRYAGQTYQLPKHGMVRNNPALQVVEQLEESITFELRDSPATRSQYPFAFVFRLRYALVGRQLVVSHWVDNPGSGPLYFSVGGHPAFRVPLFPGEVYEDYFLAFAEAEVSERYLVNAEGLIAAETRPVHWAGGGHRLPLSHELFAVDALVFKDLGSRRIGLVSPSRGEVLVVDFADFPYLGIWAKPNGDFVCIEPWLGIADAADSDGEFTTKEGILSVSPGEQFTAEYRVTIV